MWWTNHPVEPDLCSIEGDGHVVIGSIVPTVAPVVKPVVIVVAVATVTPAIPNVVELVRA